MSEQRIGIDAPEDEEAKHGLRARYFFYTNGLGLQRSDVKFEVLHSCGEWTWAHYRFCGLCGRPVQLSERHVATINANVHPANRLGGPEAQAPTRPFAWVRPDPAVAGPVGSVNNPVWAQRGPVPGMPHVIQEALPLPPPPDVQAREAARQAQQQPAAPPAPPPPRPLTGGWPPLQWG